MVLKIPIFQQKYLTVILQTIICSGISYLYPVLQTGLGRQTHLSQVLGLKRLVSQSERYLENDDN